MAERLHRIAIIMCWLAGAALVLMTLRLARHNRELAAQIGAFYRSIEVPTGARMPPLTGWDRNGDELIVNSAVEERPVLMLVFSPACPICDENWPRWDALVSVQRRQSGRVIPVDITGAVRDDYLQAHGIDSFPVMDSITAETAMAYRFRFTPQTLILDAGRVAAGWTGLLTESDVARAATILGGPVLRSPSQDTSSVLIRPACDGAPCSRDSDCGSRCTCEGYGGPTELGTCVAKPGAWRR